jgi:hypothetical protein
MARSNAGGGHGSKVVVDKPVRTGSGSTGIRPSYTNAPGSHFGDHTVDGVSTGYRGPKREDGKSFQPTPFGNEVALNVGPGGCAPAKNRDILSEFGEESSRGRWWAPTSFAKNSLIFGRGLSPRPVGPAFKIASIKDWSSSAFVSFKATSKRKLHMAQEVKYDKSHHAGATPEARIANRQRNSGGEEADTIVKTGDGARRTFHNIHNPGSARKHGSSNPREGDVTGKPRGAA